MEYKLSKDQIAFYQANGYLVIQELISGEESKMLLKSIRRHANEDFAAIMNPDREDELARQAPFSSRESVLETAALLRAYMKDARIVSILETLQSREIVGLMSQMLFKEAGSKYANQAWNPHQDNTYPRNKNKQYITTNLFFSRADKKNGSLYTYPRSQNENLLPAKDMISYREAYGANPGNTVSVPKKYKKVDLTFKDGSLLILHGNVIHGSYPNQSKTRSRPLYSCSYMTKGEKFIPGANAKRMVIALHKSKKRRGHIEVCSPNACA